MNLFRFAAMASLFAAAPALSETLTVKVTGAASGGQIVASLYATSSGFSTFNSEKAAQVKMGPVVGGAAILKFENLAPGKYSVAAFHDVDGNKKMKTNFIGIPREPVGVSNNIGGMPSFTKSLVDVPASGAIEIKLRKLGG